MKLNVKEYQNARDTWTRILDFPSSGDTSVQGRFKVINRKNEIVLIRDWYYVWKDPSSSKLAFRVTKSHWAKGRKMNIESSIPEILSGEYAIVFKAVSNSYDDEDFVIVEYCTPVLDTPRKALNWLEREVQQMEARDGITTDQIVREMKVRG